VPIVCAGALIHPGDVIVADDDGVAVVKRAAAAEVAAASKQRVDKEDVVRARLAKGELGLDIYDLRPKLKELGLEYR
jgi:4-hydroxy-4-methyl-2-oxoglutarate aldolase